MNTSYALDTYSAHNLNIMMQTSSGDVIKMDFANEHATSLQENRSDNATNTTMSFASMQAFSFSIKGDGLDAQDQKEINDFMKTAQPMIDSFIKELQEDAPQSPVTNLARKVASIFNPSQTRDGDAKNSVKNSIVKMFDNSMQEHKLQDTKRPNLEDSISNIFKEIQNLLEKTLEEFDNFNKKLYA
jgi:hypothetical protein